VLTILFFILSQIVYGQVKIGENPNTINSASILELESLEKVLVISRASADEMEEIEPLEGALIYNTDAACIFYYNGSNWQNLCAGASNLFFVDNGDGTYTIDLGDGPSTFGNPPETITSITDNMDGSYTYNAEDGQEILITTGVLNGNHIGTAGSVFFANRSTGAPFEANEAFFWDNENKRLGIGTNTPSNELHVEGILRSGRISNSFGTAAFPSYHFTGSFNSGMFAPSAGSLALASSGQEVVRVTGGNRVGISVTNPEATLHVGGDLRVDGNILVGGATTSAKSMESSNMIRRVSASTVLLTASDRTLILEGTVRSLVLPEANALNIGQLFIIKDLGGAVTKFNISYRDLENKESSLSKNKGTLWLQSDGLEWQQIN